MINILLVTHKNLAINLIEIINSIFPDLNHVNNINFQYLEINSDHQASDHNKILSTALNKINKLNNNNILIISDLYGSTPHNIAQKLAQICKTKLITGLNLPMLVKLVNYCDKNIDLNKLGLLIQQSAKDAIIYKDYSNIKAMEPEII